MLFRSDMPWQTLVALVMIVGLTALYWVMPHRRVRLRSATFGGVVAGFSWYLVLSLHVHFQIGVARYNALYSTFAAIPLFLVWLFISWIGVLCGAGLAAAHDNPMQYAWRIQGQGVDHASRLFIALGGLIVVAERHLAAGKPLTLSDIASRMSLPEPLVRNELQPFAKAELLVIAERSGEAIYSLARDVDAVHLGEILSLLEQTWVKAPLAKPSDHRLKALLEGRVLARDAATANLSLRELVKHLEGGDGEKSTVTSPPGAG